LTRVQSHVYGDARSGETSEQDSHERDAWRIPTRPKVTRGVSHAHPSQLTKLPRPRKSRRRRCHDHQFNWLSGLTRCHRRTQNFRTYGGCGGVKWGGPGDGVPQKLTHNVQTVQMQPIKT